MVVDEGSRHALFQRLEQTLGQEAATTLMEHLPPAGWADVATRHDLDTRVELLRSEMRIGSAEVRQEMAMLRADFRGELLTAVNGQTRAVILSNIGAVATMTGVAIAVTRLLSG